LVVGKFSYSGDQRQKASAIDTEGFSAKQMDHCHHITGSFFEIAIFG
jgi:hypothetical protein